MTLIFLLFSLVLVIGIPRSINRMYYDALKEISKHAEEK